MNRWLLGGTVALGCLVVEAGVANAGLVLTANPSGSQSSTISGITTESFDSFSTGKYTSLSTAVGTLSSPGLEIVQHDQYGGAGGSGNYFSIGAQSGQTSATLTLNGAQAYFGMWWSAADSQNQLEFFSKGQEIAVFDSASASGSLGSSFNANPNGGGDSSEKFAYLNFYGTNGTTFDQVVFLNKTTGTGFESDNWSVRSTEVVPPFTGSTIGGLSSVPEPSSIALTACGLLAFLGHQWRRRRPGSAM